MKLNEFLKTKRLEENLNKKDFARRLDINTVTYIYLEKEPKNQPSYRTISKLARYFNLSVQEIREMLNNEIHQ